MPKTMKLDNNICRDLIRQAKLPAPESGKLFLLGLRGVVPCGDGHSIQRSNDDPDRYNDTIVVAGTHWGLYLASVDPGLWYTKHPMNDEGCFHLADGGPYHFFRGDHRGHRALKQLGEFTGWRDTNRDFKQQPGERLRKVRGTGVDMHAGGVSPIVGPNSAGCQVIWGGYSGAPWQGFLGQIEDADLERYAYWLLDHAVLGL